MAKDIASRFRGFLPIVIDLETGGLDSSKNPLLEFAAVITNIDSDGHIYKEQTIHSHITPYMGSIVDPESLKINGIQPNHPLRIAKDEGKFLEEFFTVVRKHLKEKNCTRAIMVAHNTMFDLDFFQAAVKRAKIKNSPFHSFSTFDTVTLGGLVCGQTVLARVAESCGLEYDTKKAHGAKYDAELTADIFCQIVNRVGFPEF